LPIKLGQASICTACHRWPLNASRRDSGGHAIGQSDLAHHPALFGIQEAPQDLALEHRREHGDVLFT
jgi:hypothetical protein